MDETEIDEPISEAAGNAAASDGDMEGVATGSGAVAAGGSIDGTNISSGDRAVAFDGSNEGNINTGSTPLEPAATETVVVETVTTVTTSTTPPEPEVIEPEPLPAAAPPEPGKLEEAKVVVEEAFEQLFSDEVEAVRYLKDPPAWLAFDAIDPEVAATVEFGQILLDVAQDMTAPAVGPEVSSSVPPVLAPTPSPSTPSPERPPVPSAEGQPFDELLPDPEIPLDPPGSTEVPPLVAVEQTITRHVVEVFEDSPEVGGIMADGSADGAVVGDGNTVNNVIEAEPEPARFGAGDADETESAITDEPALDRVMHDQASPGFGQGAEADHRTAAEADEQTSVVGVQTGHDESVEAVGLASVETALERAGLEQTELDETGFDDAGFEESVDEPVSAIDVSEVDLVVDEHDHGDDLVDD